MTKRKYSTYEIVITVVSIITVITFSGYSLYMHFGFKLGETIFSGYISGFGSFLGGTFGGIIGALVAFGIARFQLNAEKEKAKSQEEIKLNNILSALSSELMHNRKILDIVNNNIDKKDEYITQLEFDIWITVRFDAIGFFKSELYDVLDEFYRECKDMKLNRLPEYKSRKIDYIVRIKTIDEVLKQIVEIKMNIKPT